MMDSVYTTFQEQEAVFPASANPAGTQPRKVKSADLYDDQHSVLV